MTQHTPAPWLYQSSAGNHDFLIYDQATGKDIALVRNYNEPNAQVIVAAPDFLAAGLLLLAAVDKGDADKAMDGYDALRAAVAKATSRV